MQTETPTSKRSPSLVQALTPLLVLIVLLSASVFIYGEDSSYGPNQIALWIASGVAIGIGFYNRFSWVEIEDGIKSGISVAMGALLIILAVGSLIGTWLLSGTVPSMIYFGLELLNPSWFYAASALICAIISLAIGSSWTTAATIGVALMGIAVGMDMSPAITAGAVVSGAYFGDKMSPLSDTTNLAPAVAGSELFQHIRYMGYTAGPAFLIALVLFVLLGFNADANFKALELERMQLELSNTYTIGWEMLVPLVVLLVLAARGKPALPSVFFGALLGGLWAVLFQPELITAIANGESSALATIMVVWSALSDGVAIETGSAELNELLSGGGMSSMLNTVWLILSAMTFGAIMEKLGLLERMIQGILGFVKSTGDLVAATLFTCFGANVLTADQYMAIVIPGRMFREEFERRGLDSRVLSRTLEDSGTITSALIPWNTCGAFMMATLAVSPLEFAPYAFFNWLTPLIALFYGYTGITILRRPEAV